ISGLVYLDSGSIVHAEYKDFVGNEAIKSLLRMINPLVSVFNNVSIPVITCKFEIKPKENEIEKKERVFKGKNLLVSKNLKLNSVLSNFFDKKDIETVILEEETKIDRIIDKENFLFVVIDDSFVTDIHKLVTKTINNFKNTYIIIISKSHHPIEHKNVLSLLKPFNLLELEQIIEFNLLNKSNKEGLLKYIENITSDKKIISIKLSNSIGLVYIKNNKIIHAEYESLLGLDALKYILNSSNINFSSLPWNDPILSTLNITFKNQINIPEVTKVTIPTVIEKKEDNKQKILIVDDDITSTKILSRFLAGQNYFTKTANSAVEGEKILLEENFDLVITDINMPEVNGLEFLLWIKQYFPETKVVIITAFHNENIKNFSNQRGAFYYFEKPVDLNEMVKLLKEAFLEPMQYSDLKMNDYVKVSMVSKLNKVIEIIDIYTQNKSYIYIKEGKIIHAESGNLKGVDALHEIFKSESGIFSDVPWKEPQENTVNYNDLLLFADEENIQKIDNESNIQLQQKQQTVMQKLHSLVEKIRSETEVFNKYTIYEEGVALEIILGKTTKKDALKIMENYSSEKFKFDEVSQVLIYQDLSLTI
ncbi:MAG: response regulator, partial [Candidatus Sericytochromatia bacterium]